MNVTFNKEALSPYIKINGRKAFVNRITEFSAGCPGHFKGSTTGGSHFHIEGGKQAGGAANDWFLDWDGAEGIHFNSLKKCIQEIEAT